MTITPMLAEDYGPILFLLFAIPVCLGLFGFGTIGVNITLGKGKWWGFLLGLVPTLGGGLFLFYFLTVGGGAPIFFHIAAAIPLVCGLLSLYLWGKDRPEWSQTVGIALRVFLYSALFIVFIYLLSMLTTK
jgi:drug/metabolite transporter (DMT)-like permease